MTTDGGCSYMLFILLLCSGLLFIFLSHTGHRGDIHEGSDEEEEEEEEEGGKGGLVESEDLRDDQRHIAKGGKEEEDKCSL